MADIHHEIKIQASPEKTFKALSTLSGLKAWHTAHIEEQDGALRFSAADKPTFLWKLTLHKGKEVVWECLEGPGDSVGTKAIYKLSETDDGRTLVEFSHTLWPNQELNFRKCNTLWAILLHHLKKYVETGKTDPAIV